MGDNFSSSGGGAVLVRGLDDLLQRMEEAEESKQLEAALTALGDQMKEEMDRNIGEHDTLKNAQEVVVKIREDGSGYAAIKPKTGGYRITKGGKSYRVKVGKGGRGKRNTAEGIKAWDLTRFTNDGHAIRKPMRLSKNYRPRIKVPFVTGKGYYDKTRKWAESAAITAMNKLANEMAGGLR